MVWDGIKIQNNNISASIIKGQRKNIVLFLKFGIRISFKNNLIASLKGCSIPKNLTLLGPLRFWVRPKILRSNSVINATFTRIGKTKIV